ncbi:MAG: hypothetical protein ISP91_13955 [Pseudomonadales bacterium]|jgi:peptidoglycan hydrolase CwlO-like protein|nr:hypothetical protein [Pseudomonadales bacterium]
MASSFWIVIGIIVVAAIIGDTIVKIVKASKSGSKHQARIDELEEHVQDVRADLQDARARIEVLEKIVTDEKYDLRREINNLAN